MRITLALCLIAMTVPAMADPFYLRYDADETFPEQSGFQRFYDPNNGPIDRTVKDGIFRLDTRRSVSLFDLYYVQSVALDLDPGEQLRVTWRMRTLESDVSLDRSDTALSITNAASQFAKFYVGEDFVSEHHLRDVVGTYPISRDHFHEFRFSSDHLEEFEFSVDGLLVFSGRFDGRSLSGPHRIAFGDSFTGLASLSEWDFVEIQVVPEPQATVPVLLSAILLMRQVRVRRDAFPHYKPSQNLLQRQHRERELREALKERRRLLPADAEAAEVLNPSDRTLDAPAAFVAPQRTPVLRDFVGSATAAMRSDQLDSLGCQPVSQRITIVGLVANDSLGQVTGQHEVEQLLNELALVTVGRRGVDRDRKSAGIRQNHDFHAFSGFGIEKFHSK